MPLSTLKSGVCRLLAGTLALAFVGAANISEASVPCDPDPLDPTYKCPDETKPPEKKKPDGEDKKPEDMTQAEYDKKFSILRLYGEVTAYSAQVMIQTMQLMDDKPTDKPITIIINSPGGSVLQGIAIIDTMNSLRRPVRTVCEGHAMSMGAYILMSGRHGLREALPGCKIMVHEASNEMKGTNSDIKNNSTFLDHQNEDLAQILAKNTGIDIDDANALILKDQFFSAAQAKELGIVDTIIAPLYTPPALQPRPLPAWLCERDATLNRIGKSALKGCQSPSSPG